MNKIKLAIVTFVAIGFTACTNMDNLVNNLKWQENIKPVTSGVQTENTGFVEAEIEILNEEDEIYKEGFIDGPEDFIGGAVQPQIPQNFQEETGAEIKVEAVQPIKKGVREFPTSRMTMKQDKKIYLDTENTPYTGDFVLIIGGKVEYRESYVNGVLNGNKVWYNSKGQAGLVEPYVNGRKTGTQITYYPNGAVRSKIEYSAGRVNGDIQWFDAKGKLINSSKIVNGNGTWIAYSYSGKLREKGVYKNGRRDGVWMRYLESGALEKKDTYKNGKLIKREWY